MPKMKTKSAASKRIKITATGKMKRKRAFHSHILTKKTVKQKRRLRTATLIDSTDEGRFARMIQP
ncbi:MAG: 50S ribosomal protein L35 [Bacteroidia bacterium]|nr:50S ribosomal protein L35 [Bacteroidia bacterium]